MRFQLGLFCLLTSLHLSACQTNSTDNSLSDSTNSTEATTAFGSSEITINVATTSQFDDANTTTTIETFNSTSEAETTTTAIANSTEIGNETTTTTIEILSTATATTLPPFSTVPPELLYCSNGDQPYVYPSSSWPLNCISSPFACPSGYECEPAQPSLSDIRLCCPAGCAEQSVAYINPLTGKKLECLQGSPYGCPSGFQCNGRPFESVGTCCSTCPNGTTPYTRQNQPLQCIPGIIGSCPFNYQCQASESSQYDHYCCPQQKQEPEQSECPNGGEASKNRWGATRRCRLNRGRWGRKGCPWGFSCQANAQEWSQKWGVCCSTTHDRW